MRYAFSFLFAVSCCFLLGATSRGWTDDDEPIPQPKVEPRANLKASEILAILDEAIDRDEIAEPIEFGKALERINTLPFRIDMSALREIIPEIEDARSTVFKFPEQPARLQIRHILNSFVDQYPEKSAGWVVGPGYVEITSSDRALAWSRLSSRVTLNVRGRPLFLVLEDLFEQTGVSITLDPRFAQRARAPVSATFSDPVTLRDALYLLTNMADLQMVSVGNSVFVTSPQNAFRIFWQRRLIREISADPLAPQL